MIQYNIHDQTFQKQLINAKPQTKEFINQMVYNYEQENKIKAKQMKELKLKSIESRKETAQEKRAKFRQHRGDLPPTKEAFISPQRKETEESMIIMPRRRDTYEEFPLVASKLLQQKQKKLIKDGEVLKQRLRENFKRIIEDQMKLDENELEEEKPNINLKDFFIEKEDPKKRQEQISDLLSGGVIGLYKREKKIHSFNRQNPAIQKFRKIVEKHLMTHTLKDIERLKKNKVDITLVSKMSQFVDTLALMFPKMYKEGCIGHKLEKIAKNIFLNEFLYGVLAEIPSQIDQDIMRDNFSLNHSEEQVICDVTLLDRKINLNNIFNKQIDRDIFFQQAKLPKMIAKDINFIQKQAMTKYFEIQTQHKQVVRPNFLTVQKNLLFLTERRIAKEHAEALSKYLEMVREMQDQRVYRLVIEACSMQDDAFAMVLKGIKSQCINEVVSGKIKNQYLQTLIYSNNAIGLKSLEELCQLIPRMAELVLNNLEFQYDPQIKSHDMLQQILSKTAYVGTKLMKLKLSKLDLSHPETVRLIIETISYNKNMISIDLSFGQLTPNQLAEIVNVLAKKARCLRSLNLSNNLLDFDVNNEDNLENSQLFIQKVREFTEIAIFVNHINFSKMGLGKSQISELLEIFKNCQFLLAIHLSDNDINKDKDFFYECLENFHITEEDLIDINRSKLIEAKLKPQQKDGRFKIDYKNELKEYFNMATPIPNENQMDEEDHIGTGQIRKRYKDHFLLCQEYKILEQYKAINRSQIYYGLGRQEDNIFDRFILTRKLNHPELIFNQSVRDDKKKTRFFKRDADSGWRLSQKDECYVCNKYQYTMIFYERTAIMHQNKDFVEILDPVLLGKFKREFDINYRTFNSMGPIICGSVVNKSINQGKFDRKLKMVRAPIFSLLQICHTREFSTSSAMTRIVKDGVIKYLQYESKKLLEELKVEQYFEGWEELMMDKCSKNELMDIKSINLPNFDHNQKKLDVYVYAGYFKPGYHQVLIYDPILERAFCKDFVLNLNLREDIYPEYPILEGAKIIRKVRNVWKPWLEDTEEDVAKAFTIDRAETEDFYAFEIIKNKEDAQKVLDILKESFDVIKVYQKHLQVQSNKYPQISWDRFWWHLNHINKTSKMMTKKENLTQAMAELCFIRATRNDETKGLKSAIQRCELFEMIIRLAMQWIKTVWSARALISDHLREFVNIYLVPYYQGSILINERAAIRDSKHLNQLLYDNQSNLELLMEKIKGANRHLTLERCADFLLGLESDKIGLKYKLIEQCFIYSMMTVLDEVKDMKKYDFLYFVEFLEFLCRLAITGVLESDTIEYKVHALLEIIWDQMYALKVFNQKEHQLMPVDESQFKCI